MSHLVSRTSTFSGSSLVIFPSEATASADASQQRSEDQDQDSGARDVDELTPWESIINLDEWAAQESCINELKTSRRLPQKATWEDAPSIAYEFKVVNSKLDALLTGHKRIQENMEKPSLHANPWPCSPRASRIHSRAPPNLQRMSVRSKCPSDTAVSLEPLSPRSPRAWKRLSRRSSKGPEATLFKLRKFCTPEAVRRTASRQFHGKMRMPHNHVFSPTPSLTTRTASKDNLTVSGFRRAGYKKKRRWLRPLMPNSKLAFFLDVVSLLFLAYDSVIIPLILAWDQRIDGYFLWSAWVTAIFWSSDVAMNFAKSFTRDAVVITSFRQVALHYLKGRFVCDATMVVFDWLSIFLETFQGVNGPSTRSVQPYWYYVRLLKITRLFRVLYMIKAGRIAQITDTVQHKLHVSGLASLGLLLASLVKLVLVIMWVNHLVACVWIALETKWEKHAAKSWQLEIAQQHVSHSSSFSEAGLSRTSTYCIAYYWALSTMFGGMSYLDPMTTAESIFSALYVLFGALAASGMISSMAATLVERSEQRRERNVRLLLLQRYLQQYDVDAALSLMVRRQVLERLSVPPMVPEGDVAAIKSLSAEMKDQLHYHVWFPTLVFQPLWRTCLYVDDTCIRNLCRSALENANHHPGEILFAPGEDMKHSYIVLWGSMQYTVEESRLFRPTLGNGGSVASLDMCSHGVNLRMNPSYHTDGSLDDSVDTESYFDDGDTQQVMISARQQVCEIALWAEWVTVGLTETITPCELLKCSAQALLGVVAQNSPTVATIMRSYAEALISFLEKEKPMGVSDVCAVDDYDSVVAQMPVQTRVLMSMPSLCALKKGMYAIASAKWDLLEQEVHDGKCNLRQDESGKVLRVVQIVAVRLTRTTDGYMCVKLGEFPQSRKTAHITVNLPGVKTHAQEGMVPCTCRLLAKYFPSVEPSISWEGFKVDIEEKPSASCGLRTKYITTVVEAEIDEDVHDPHMKMFMWEDEAIECFVSSEEVEADAVDVHVLAWMSPAQYASLKTLSSSKCETLVCTWMQPFVPEVEYPGNTSPRSLGEGSRSLENYKDVILGMRRQTSP